MAIGLRTLEDPKPIEIVGSGFIFDSKGYVMTAGHVLLECQRLQKEYKENGIKAAIVAYKTEYLSKNDIDLRPIVFEKLTVEILNKIIPDSAAPENMDIGYGKLKGNHDFDFLEIGPSPNNVSDEILLCGYPGGFQTFSMNKSKDIGIRFSPVLQYGRISGFMPNDEDPINYGIQTDIVGTEGSSGSPIINQKDCKVIGLAQSVLYSYFQTDDKTLSGKAKIGLVWGTSNLILSVVANAVKVYFETGENIPRKIPFTTYSFQNVAIKNEFL